jgi:phosphate transport system protein
MEFHTILSYDKDLSILRSKITLMLSMVEQIYSSSIKIFYNCDKEVISQALVIDKKVNLLDEEIENLAVQILALRSPIGRDLREAVSAIKIAVVLERMGDLSKNTINRLADKEIVIADDIMINIEKLHTNIASMIIKLHQAYRESDIVIAKEIFIYDNHIDELYNQVKSQLEEYIEKHPKTTKQIMKVIFALKNYERFADYICKIASLILYISSSERRFVSL